MNNIELSHGFPKKLGNVMASGAAFVFGRDPLPAYNRIYREAYAAEQRYRSPREFQNPPLETLESEMGRLADLCINEAPLNSLPWTDHKFSQGLHLSTMLSFSDQHNAPVVLEYFVPERARAFVDEISALADEKGRQITIPEQFATALELSDGSVLGASVIAHAGSRSIARGSETRIDPKFRYTLEETAGWRDDVASFEGISGDYGDPSGDNYHFWGMFISGLLSENGDRLRDKILNPIYRQLYTNAAEATRLLRYGVGGKQGDTHKEVDLTGYHLGSLIGSMASK